jgi:hypothetical protein
MSTTEEKVANDLIGAAGVHFVAFKLSLRGLIALPTIRNTAGIDLLVSNPKTQRQAVLQVKTSGKNVTFWPTSKPEKCLRGPNSYYAFLRYLAEKETFEVFLETGDRVADQIAENAKNYVERGRKEFNHWTLVNEDQLRTAWKDWTL